VVRIVLSSDATGFSRNATLIASILRRTAARVEVRFYTRGFDVASFEQGQLKVEFTRCEEPVTGKYPGHVPQAVFDRLRIIADESRWDRVLVMDHDMVVLCDLAPYFREAFGDALLMGRLFGPGNTLGLQMSGRGGLPPALKHCEDYPYFYMGPMMNLAAMRAEGTWDRLLAAHQLIGEDEQISLTAACGGKVRGVDKRWNLVPEWDKLKDAAARVPREGETVENGITWIDGVPAGVIHWTGGAKPWHRHLKVWRSDLWEAENVSWEVLRHGGWDKPPALEVGSGNGRSARGLYERGWKVSLIPAGPHDGSDGHPGREIPPHPDVEILDRDPALVRGEFRMVRFWPGTRAAGWLGKFEHLPPAIVLEGPLDFARIEEVRTAGYLAQARLLRRQWADGGPDPEVLHFAEGDDLPVGEDEMLYLARSPSEAVWPVPSGYGRPQAGLEPPLPPAMLGYFEDGLTDMLGAGSTVLVIASIPATRLLAGKLPFSRVISLHHDLPLLESEMSAGAGENVEFVAAPFACPLECLDLRALPKTTFDLVVVGPPRDETTDLLPVACSLAGSCTPDAKIIAVGKASAEIPAKKPASRRNGWVHVESAEGLLVLQATGDDSSRSPGPSPVALSNFVARGMVIHPSGLGGEAVRAASEACPGIEYEEVELNEPAIDEIPWVEVMAMYDGDSPGWPRREYVARETAAKRAMIEALRSFVESGAASVLILQDKCRWDSTAAGLLEEALGELPSDWDLVYLQLDVAPDAEPVGPRLAKLGSAFGSMAILWSRKAAMRLLPGLEKSGREWGVFLQRKQRELNAYCAVPLPVRRQDG
jgi:lipopolysaccharide biosynthesis glycosyltransferase